MVVTVKFFAIFREMVGKKNDSQEIEEGTTVEQLWRRYASENPKLEKIRAAYSVNRRLAKPEQVLQDGDEVGFLPPVSGGATRKATKKTLPKTKNRPQRARASGRRRLVPDVAVTRRKLDLAALIRRVEFSGAGAIVTFSGVVRDNARGQAVDHLEYEAYPEMAETLMRDILGEIKERWGEVRVAMAHRIGRLKIGESSLMIAVAAPHRPEAYAASRYAIERVKAVLPVWKKEFGVDGEYWVEGPVAGESPPETAESIAREAEYTPF